LACSCLTNETKHPFAITKRPPNAHQTPPANPQQAAAEAEAEELRSSLDATNELLTKAMGAAAQQEAEATEAMAAKQKELDAALVRR